MRRDDVASTLIRRHFGTKYPRGGDLAVLRPFQQWSSEDSTNLFTYYSQKEADIKLLKIVKIRKKISYPSETARHFAV